MSTNDLLRVRRILREAMPELQERYGVGSLAVFGSLARGDATAGSDVDILVRFAGEPPGLFGFVRLERHLSELLGLPVDLVMESALKPQLRERILEEAVAA
jgi:uncharacterized protein